MQETLIIWLNATHPDRVSWAVFDAAGNLRDMAQMDSPQGLSAVALNKKVIVLAAADAILLTTIIMPPLKTAKLLKALPFALEDQLIDDIDTLHFAVGQRKTDNSIPVAVCSKAKMQQWLALLSSWGITPDELTSQVFAVPYQEKTAVVLHDQYALIRINAELGLSIDIAMLPIVLVSVLREHPDLSSVSILQTPEQSVMSLNLSVPVKEVMLSAAEKMSEAFKGLNSAPYTNLLQGDFVVKKTKRFALKNQWKITAYLASAWIVLLFLSPLMSALMLNHATVKVDDQIASIYRHQFPNATTIVAPKERMQAKLQKMTGSLTENRWLLLLAYVSDAVNKNQGIQIKKLDLQHNMMTADVAANSAEHFSAFMQALKQDGLMVKEQNALVSTTLVKATLTIE